MFTNPGFTLADQIYWTIDLFVKVMAQEACKLRLGPLSFGLWSRVMKFRRRFLALYEQWKAGRAPKASARRSAGAASISRPNPPPGDLLVAGDGGPGLNNAARMRPASVLPRRSAWMHKVLPQSAAALGAYIGPIVSNHPEVKAFVAEVPQAGRLLRPICRMVAVKMPEWLALPKRHRQPARRRPPTPPRPRQPRGPYADAKEEARAWMRWSEATGKPVDPKKMSPAGFGCVLHMPRDGNCPPPEIGYGGRWPPLPKDYIPPRD